MRGHLALAERAPGLSASPPEKNIVEIDMDTTEVFCVMRINVVPVEGDCFTSPRIGSGHRRTSQAAGPPPPRGHIPSESDSGISHSAISVSIN